MGWLIVAGVGWLIMGATSATCNKTVWALILHINIQITLQLNSNARSLNASWNQLQSECFKDPPKEIWIWTQFLKLQAMHLSALGPEFYLLNRIVFRIAQYCILATVNWTQTPNIIDVNSLFCEVNLRERYPKCVLLKVNTRLFHWLWTTLEEGASPYPNIYRNFC